MESVVTVVLATGVLKMEASEHYVLLIVYQRET
jgi:hypothetical protein